MDKWSLMKVRQGQTLFYATRSGSVGESFVTKKPYLLDGWPCVETITRHIMSNGVPVTDPESCEMTFWHSAQYEFTEMDFLITTSRARALRWAREGWEWNPDPISGYTDRGRAEMEAAVKALTPAT